MGRRVKRLRELILEIKNLIHQAIERWHRKGGYMYKHHKDIFRNFLRKIPQKKPERFSKRELSEISLKMIKDPTFQVKFSLSSSLYKMTKSLR